MRITPSQQKIVYTLGVGLSDINPALFRYYGGGGAGCNHHNPYWKCYQPEKKSQNLTFFKFQNQIVHLKKKLRNELHGFCGGPKSLKKINLRIILARIYIKISFIKRKIIFTLWPESAVKGG